MPDQVLYVLVFHIAHSQVKLTNDMTGNIFDNKDLDLAIELYQSAEQLAGIGSYEIRLATGEMTCSENLCRLLGHEKPSYTCSLSDFLAIVHSEDQPVLQERFSQSIADSQPFEIEFRVLHPEGGVKVFYQKCKVLTREGGSSSMVGIVQDITERKNAELIFQEQAHFIKKVAETAPDLISVFNLREQKLEYLNHKNSEIFGYSDAEMMDMERAKQHALVLPDDRILVREYFERLTNEPTDAAHIVEYRALDKDGRVQWFRSQGKVFKRDAEGNTTHCLNVIHNITTAKDAEANLRKKEALLNEAERIARMGSWERNIKTNELMWSDELYRLFGLEPASVPLSIAFYLDNIVHPEDRELVATYMESFAKGEIEPVEYRIVRPGGEERWVCVKAQIEHDAEGGLAYIRGVNSDITLQKRADQELRNLNKALVRKNRDLQNLNAELASLANITGYELKDPLRKVYSFLEMIANKEINRLSETGRTNLRRAQASLQRMSLLTDDVLAFTEVSNQKESKSKLDLDQVVGFAVNKLKDKVETLGVVIDYSELPVVKGYRGLLSNLFYHLIDNAIRFRNETAKPYIRISAEVGNGKAIGIAETTEEGEYLKIQVADNGLGFMQKDSEQIFNIFSPSQARGRGRGTGVSLAICKKIVDKHHGFIMATSPDGEGAVFTILLPL